MANPQNPYVFNEYLFANQDHLDFNNSAYGLIHTIVDILAPTIGLFTASLVAYLTLFQTPAHVRAFSRMLFLCSVTDILYAIGNLACMARLQSSKSATIFSNTGFISYFSYPVQCYTLSVTHGIYALSNLIVPIQYIFRYQTLKMNTPSSQRTAFVYFGFCVIIALVNVYTATTGLCSFQNPNNVDYGQFWFKEVPIPVLMVAMHDFPPANRQVSLYSTVVLLSYIVSIVFARLTVTELKKQKNYMSPKTVAIQKELGKMLFVQLLIPLSISIIPITLANITTQAGIDLGYTHDALSCLMGFFPLLNSTSTLYYIKAYKQYCLENFLPCCIANTRNPEHSSTPQIITRNSISGLNPNRVSPVPIIL